MFLFKSSKTKSQAGKTEGKQKGIVLELKKRTLEDELADCLPSFSMDLVKMIEKYLSFISAYPNVKTKKLVTVTQPSEGQFWGGTCDGIAVSPDRHIWVSCDGGKSVCVFNMEGKFVRSNSATQWSSPRGMAFDSNGDVYVANWGKNQIVVCRNDGTFVRTIGKESSPWSAMRKYSFDDVPSAPEAKTEPTTATGTATKTPTTETKEAKFGRPYGVATDGNGLIFVSEYDGQVQVVNRDGTSVRTMKTGTAAGLVYTPSGQVSVVDCNATKVHVFNVDGTLSHSFGNENQKTLEAGKGMFSAWGLGVFPNGDFVVTASSSMYVFDPKGNFITRFQADSNQTMYSVCCDDEGRIYLGGSSCAMVLAFVAREAGDAVIDWKDDPSNPFSLL